MVSLNPDSDTEILNQRIPAGRAEYFLFDFDGTISTLRHGWETVMKPVMMESVIGTAAVGADRRAAIERDIDAYISDSTGIQTILQMTWLCGYVQAAGLAEPREALNYKQAYDRQLKAYIADRKRAAAAGKREDYLIPGAIAFLQAIRDRGRSLMVISGTDIDDVREEAELLGVAHFFDGGIFGSVNDVNKYSKKQVITRLIADRNLTGDRLVVTGDGPVEIRCAREAGGVGIGVTCVEADLKGRDRAKYERVKKAGADVIITDFRDKDYLLDYLCG